MTAEQLARDEQFYNLMQRYRHTSIVAMAPTVDDAYLAVCEHVVGLFTPTATVDEAPADPGVAESPADVLKTLGGLNLVAAGPKLEVAREVCVAFRDFVDGFVARIDAVLRSRDGAHEG